MQRDVLHSGVRQYLHRMIICLGDELFGYVPLAVSLLLKNCKVCIVYRSCVELYRMSWISAQELC